MRIEVSYAQHLNGAAGDAFREKERFDGLTQG